MPILFIVSDPALLIGSWCLARRFVPGVLMHDCIGGGRRAGIYTVNVIIFDVSQIANILVFEHRYIVGREIANDMRRQHKITMGYSLLFLGEGMPR